MQNNDHIFMRSLRELKRVRCLALAAVLIALNIALDLLGVRIVLSPNLRISWGFLCNASVSMLFGPVVGIMTGFCTDVLGYFAGNFTMGGYFFGNTITAMVGGLIYGLWLYPRKISLPRVIGAKTCINVICNIGLNTYWLSLVRGEAMTVLLPARVAKNLLLLPLEILMMYAVLRIVDRVYRALPSSEPSQTTRMKQN